MASYTLQSSPDSYSVKKRQKFIIDELNMSHFYVSLRWIITSSVELFIGSLDLAAALPVELPFSSFTLATKT